MNDRLYIFIAALVGVICGFITIHSPMAHSWTSAIFWVVVGLIIIYFSSNRQTAMFAAGVFAFLDIAAWLFSGFQGTTTAQVHGILLIMLIASTLCATAAVAAAYVFYWLFRRN